jgi:phage N-6-adenine-methyltransferase
MSQQFNSRGAITRDDWETPKSILDALGLFDLDPAASRKYPTRCAKVGYCENGLSREWRGRVWLNPPYGTQALLWLKRLAEHGNGIALIIPRLGSKWFHEIVLAHCAGILFVKGRIAFIHPETRKPVAGNVADSILVAFGGANVNILIASSIDGIVWDMRG